MVMLMFYSRVVSVVFVLWDVVHTLKNGQIRDKRYVALL